MVLPAAIPVTRPELLIVATPVADEVHVPPETPSDNVVVRAGQMVVGVPDIVPAEMAGSMVMP